MKVIISDYKEQMESDYSLTIQAMRSAFKEEPQQNMTDTLEKTMENELKIEIIAYGEDEFWERLADADGLITAFIPIDDEFLNKAPKLKYISINAAGFSNIDMEAAVKHGVTVSHIREYCTREVSEHALALLMALNNNLEIYREDIEQLSWNYGCADMRPTLDKLSVVIYGFGKIGRRTALLLKNLGCQVSFVDPYVSQEAADLAMQGAVANYESYGGEKADITITDGSTGIIMKLSHEEVPDSADVIINHMALTESNYHIFDYEFFKKCQRKPIFINVGRGGCVDEVGLKKALDEKLIYGAGLDVLEDENPDLSKCPFLNRSNVLLTPHAAFYSRNSMERLQSISGKNLGYMLAGQNKYVDEIC